jgi:hypothetical protein
MISDPFYSEAGARFNHHLLRTVELVYSGTVYTARVLYQGANSFLLSISEFLLQYVRYPLSDFFSFFTGDGIALFINTNVHTIQYE